MHVPPPPCEGFQFLLTLRILEGFDLARLERNGVEHLDTVYRAIRLAAGVRIANNNPAPDKLARLLADDHVEKLRARVRDGRPIAGPTEQWIEPPAGGEDPGHTTSFSIADRDGNLVCVTQSLGSPFGSGIVVPGTGVCLNNFLYWTEVTPEQPQPHQARRRAADVHVALDLHLGRPAGAGAGHARQLRHPADPGAGAGAIPRFRPAAAGGDRGAAGPAVGRPAHPGRGSHTGGHHRRAASSAATTSRPSCPGP